MFYNGLRDSDHVHDHEDSVIGIGGITLFMEWILRHTETILTKNRYT